MLPIFKLIMMSITKNLITFGVIKTFGIKYIYKKIVKFNRKIINNRNIEIKVNNIIKYSIRLPYRIYNTFKK